MSINGTLNLPLKNLRAVLGNDGLEINLREEFGSLRENHRRLLRQGLRDALAEGSASREELEAVLNLDLVPTLKECRISISHCRELGGWASSPVEHLIGFDIESEERVRETAIRRVSDDEEIRLAPHPAALWTAKECSFKRLRGPEQPATFANVNVSYLQERDGLFVFRVKTGALVFEGCSWKILPGVWASLS